MITATIIIIGIIVYIRYKKKKASPDVSKELIKYQKLLKKGIITQEEFDKKKEELLKL
ncbi:SHOCT domain-containing protein [Fructilactobacillus lindneri]|uniref:SHOCT domain-containing protein n=1 Tax=Fructilactobacillus lindneri DSM 20690 = JCM 11027 TaxID=1122148 RepID=A0A0R2JYM2_9LACO|nr:SHOCT domain-containing protein [Fructilactobacillus lindneri]KRN80028.1 hypothetical protein IV52_GL000146 [Fructilactobacillus lindneri DSM 20690 = JCM 11027]SJZ98609.1 Short C-terminal domain-containing protein [Fructilactobacillus lindneri DSM 20690 = JCM 11027]